MNKKSQVGVQGCRFGPESKPNPGFTIFRSGLVPSVAFFPNMFLGRNLQPWGIVPKNEKAQFWYV